jgi:hypothetical protein
MVTADETVDNTASSIQVNIFGGAEKTRMTRAAALHLYRLLQRYSWCLASNDYVRRWMQFWPSISSAERVLIVRTVKANCGGQFGRRMLIANMPADFEYFEFDVTPVPIPAEVEREYAALLSSYFDAYAGAPSARDWVRARCRKEFAFLSAVGALERVFGAGAWVCPERARVQCQAAYMENGWDNASALNNATAISKCLFWFYESWEA